MTRLHFIGGSKHGKVEYWAWVDVAERILVPETVPYGEPETYLVDNIFDGSHVAVLES